MRLLQERKTNYFKNRKLPKEFEIKDNIKTYNFNFDVSKPLKIYSPVLKGSVTELVDDHTNPEALEQKLIVKADAKKLRIQKEKEDKKKRLIESQYNDDSALLKRRMQEKKLKRMMALKEQRKEKIKTQRKASQAKAAVGKK